MSRSQEDWLAHDVKDVRRLSDANPKFAGLLADLTDVDRHARYLVVADLVWQIWSLATGASVLITEDLRAPLMVVQRSIFEALATLGYLVQHPKSQDEAVTFLAFSYLKESTTFPEQATLVADREAILSRMPPNLVAEAKRRLKEQPRTWSGKTIEVMAKQGNVSGYDSLYRWLSAEAHIRLVGRHVRVMTPGDGTARIKAGFELQSNERESNANFTRRALHSAFKILWHVFDGPPIQVQTEDPELWQPGGQEQTPKQANS